MEAAKLRWARLGTLLVDAGLVSEQEAEEIFAEHRSSGRRFGDIAVARGLITAADLARALATQQGMPFVDLDETGVDAEAARLLSASLARRYHALPISADDDGLVVALSNPADMRANDDLRLALGGNVRFVVASADDVQREAARVYRTEIEIADADADDLVEQDDQREEIWQGVTSVPAVKLVNATLAQAIEDGASDIHFEPEEGAMRARARVDGVMREVTSIPKTMQAAVLSRLKVMGGLDIAERRAPQDGRMALKLDNRPVDVRVAVLPTTHGEQVVLRILHRAAVSGLDDLGMDRHGLAEFARAIRQPYGAIVVCGPTGSGKTTTLYSALNVLNDPGRVLMTIEDPVEHQIAGINQIEIEVKAGLTFARGLRTILRSDPDVLLVGEIRDEEAARIAFQAAATGHLVLTSLHAQNAPSAIARLIDMGIDAGTLIASLSCVIAQRLARRLCLECREAYVPDDDEREELDLQPDASVQLYRARGCSRCAETGYAGRIALYEVMPVQGKLRRLFGASTEEILETAVADGMVTLRQNGITLCLGGVTSLDEIRRVMGNRAL